MGSKVTKPVQPVKNTPSGNSLRRSLRLTKVSPVEEAIARTRAEQRQYTLLLLHHIAKDNYAGVNEAINHNAQLEYNNGQALKDALARGQADIISLLILRGARTDRIQAELYPANIRQILVQNGRVSQYKPLISLNTTVKNTVNGNDYFV